jgi:thioredoxin-related protein
MKTSKVYHRTMKWAMTIGALWLAASLSAQVTVKWLSWDEAIELSKQEPRKFFVDVYTDWCGWCKKMDNATFADAEVATYLNTRYYPIKFNAEQRAEIRINDKTYQYVRNGMRGYHQLAREITFGRLSYPTGVFMDENLKVIQPIPGYKTPVEFEMIMKYFAENHHKTTPWQKYCDKYQGN